MKIKICKADALFSTYIRERDRWTCQRCHRRYEPPTSALHCSHFWGRGRENTCFAPNNCDALCFGCHRIWGHGDGREDYIAFKKRQLGEDGYKRLTLEAHRYKKRDGKLAIIVIKYLLDELNGTDDSRSAGQSTAGRMAA